MASPYAQMSLPKEIMVCMPDGSVRRRTRRPDRPRQPMTLCGSIRSGYGEGVAGTWDALRGPANDAPALAVPNDQDPEPVGLVMVGGAEAGREAPNDLEETPSSEGEDLHARIQNLLRRLR